MRFCIYARVSSELSDVKNSIDAQLAECRKWAQVNEHTIVAEFIDEAISGRHDDRPQLQAMLVEAKKKQIQQSVP
jgi:site-specific DNA recombinase